MPVSHSDHALGRHRGNDFRPRRQGQGRRFIGAPGIAATIARAIDKRAGNRDKAEKQEPDREPERTPRPGDDRLGLRRQRLAFAR